MLRAIAVGFVLYALYTASFLPGMLVAPTVPILLFGTISKTVLAFACAVGIWTGRPWAPVLVMLTGIVIAVLWMVYGFVLGIVAYLYGVAMAVTAVLLTLIMAAYVRGAPSSRVV